jgi:hypothetical protein
MGKSYTEYALDRIKLLREETVLDAERYVPVASSKLKGRKKKEMGAFYNIRKALELNKMPVPRFWPNFQFITMYFTGCKISKEPSI